MSSSACYCLLPPPPSPGKHAKFDANDSDNVQLKGLTAQYVDLQYLNPQLSTSEDVKLEHNPAYTDTELHKPTTEPLGKEDVAGETSDYVKFGMHLRSIALYIGRPSSSGTGYTSSI